MLSSATFVTAAALRGHVRLYQLYFLLAFGIVAWIFRVPIEVIECLEIQTSLVVPCSPVLFRSELCLEGAALGRE